MNDKKIAIEDLFFGQVVCVQYCNRKNARRGDWNPRNVHLSLILNREIFAEKPGKPGKNREFEIPDLVYTRSVNATS